MTSRPAARAIAFYLPQFHPIPENDEWWGPGFTEWTNVARAKKLYPGHYQPRVPADLGFYDLRVPEVREAQANMARRHGVEGFCYWHYWFAGKRLLERPFAEVLASGAPDYPFCLGWANETWSGIWHGAPRRILMEQRYPGDDDHDAHFDANLPAFLDRRYLRVDGRPIFVIYRPLQIPHVERFVERWQQRAVRNGLPGLFFLGIVQPGEHRRVSAMDGNIIYEPHFERLRLWGLFGPAIRHGIGRLYRQRKPVANLPPIPQNRWPMAFSYENFVNDAFNDWRSDQRSIPVVVPSWDNTPRSGKKGLIFFGVTPDLFERHVRKAVALLSDRPPERRLVFIRSWNEWAEGNHLEPDLRHGMSSLEALSRGLSLIT